MWLSLGIGLMSFENNCFVGLELGEAIVAGLVVVGGDDLAG